MESEATLIIRPRGQRYISMLDPRYDKIVDSVIDAKDYEKITLQQFNLLHSDNPGFYKIKQGDLFDVWNKNDLKNEPKTYKWNGSKLERFILIGG